ncbi:hypothetical protein L1887_59696 [Cichorium endivia]|nr:hypothetical protein L1887_59696 [Cichorium endivia]
MTCNLGGYGLCSLEGDAQEMAACVSHLRSTRSKRSGKVVLMGHSTGCQDIVAYLLSAQRAASALTKIDAAVLQAPVSDREFFELTRSSAEEQVRADMDRELQHATQLHLSGKDAQLVPPQADRGHRSADHARGQARRGGRGPAEHRQRFRRARARHDGVSHLVAQCARRPRRLFQLRPGRPTDLRHPPGRTHRGQSHPQPRARLAQHRPPLGPHRRERVSARLICENKMHRALLLTFSFATLPTASICPTVPLTCCSADGLNCSTPQEPSRL